MDSEALTPYFVGGATFEITVDLNASSATSINFHISYYGPDAGYYQGAAVTKILVK